MVLVVGATGQLGTAVVRKLVAEQRPVRAFVRGQSDYDHLEGPGVELALGDLRDASSVAAACEGVDTVIATANAIIPAKGDDFESVEGEGYRNLIAACRQQGVKHFVYQSTPSWPMDDQVPTLKYKRLNEQRLQESGLNYTIVRASVFMDCWLALIGSSIPTRGTEAATVERPFWFLRLFMRAVGTMIDDRGLALLAGSGQARHAFITVDDVARFLAGCVDNPEAYNAIFHLGGPEVYSWDEAVAVFSQTLGKKIRPIHLPAGLFRFNQVLLSPITEGPSNIMGMNWAVGTCDSAYDTADVYRILDEPMTTMEEFLEGKIQLATAGSRGQLQEAYS